MGVIDMVNGRLCETLPVEEVEQIRNESYNQALEDFAKKMNRMLGDTDLRDNGYYIENLVSIAKNELKKKHFKQD